MTAYTAPRNLPVRSIQPGDEVLHDLSPTEVWIRVVAGYECDDAGCPRGEHCAGALEYPAGTVHYDRLTEPIVRIPCEPDPATTPAGPAPADTVWMSIARAGLDMHRLPRDTSADQLPDRTTCDRPTWAGIWLTARHARERHSARTCPRCWPVTP